MSQPVQLPRWIDIGLLPLWNLCIALAVAGLVVLAIGLLTPALAFDGKSVVVAQALIWPSIEAAIARP